MTLLSVTNLAVQYGGRKILDDVSFSLAEGRWLMLVGPNGAGKSTLVKAIAQGVSYRGSVCYRGEDVKRYRPHVLARHIGVLSQSHHVSYSFTVGEVVRLGRYSHAPGIFSQKQAGDERCVREALELTGMLPLAGRSVLTLSGGELQRVFLAQLFAQNPQILILDEPTNHLDLVYQKQVFALLETWLRAGKGRGILSVVHDLSLARAYGTDAVLLDRGTLIASGAADTVFSPEHLERAYSMDVYAWMRAMLSQWEAGRETFPAAERDEGRQDKGVSKTQ